MNDQVSAGKEPTGSLDLLTISEVARLLKVSRGTVYQLLHGDQLLSLKIGRSRRIRRRDLEDFIERALGDARGDSLTPVHQPTDPVLGMARVRLPRGGPNAQ